jgi:hypothetical protein
MPVNQDLGQKVAKPSFALIRSALRYEPKDTQGSSEMQRRQRDSTGEQAELLFGIGWLDKRTGPKAKTD